MARSVANCVTLLGHGNDDVNPGPDCWAPSEREGGLVRRQMKTHSAYTESAWQRDEAQRLSGRRLTCPDCGSDQRYAPSAGTHPDGSPRHYRACKVCGFWQEADGTPAYRVWQSAHDCRRELGPAETFTCEYCNQDVSTNSHPCGKYLRPDEDGYDCGTCGDFQGIETSTPFLLTGSGD